MVSPWWHLTVRTECTCDEYICVYIRQRSIDVENENRDCSVRAPSQWMSIKLHPQSLRQIGLWANMCGAYIFKILGKIFWIVLRSKMCKGGEWGRLVRTQERKRRRRSGKDLKEDLGAKKDLGMSLRAWEREEDGHHSKRRRRRISLSFLKNSAVGLSARFLEALW